MERKQVIKLKVAVIGSKGSGKTSFIRKLIDEKSEEQEEEMGQYEVYMYFATTKSIHLEIQLWDCTTHHFEFHKHLRQAYFRNSSAAILIFDISKPKWKDEAHSWISEAYDNQCYLVYAVATKLDLITNPRASKKGLQQELAPQFRIRQLEAQAHEFFKQYDIKLHFQSLHQKLKPNIRDMFIHMHDEFQIVSRGSIARGLPLDNLIESESSHFTISAAGSFQIRQTLPVKK